MKKFTRKAILLIAMAIMANISLRAVNCFNEIITHDIVYAVLEGFERVSCLEPNNLIVSDLTETTVELAWSENNAANEWTIEYKEGGYFLPGDGTATSITVNENPYTLSGLSASTTYSWYVRTNCGGTNGESAWSNIASFTTACKTVNNFPYTENFEAVSLGTTPPCWTNMFVSGTTEWEVKKENEYTNPNHTLFFNYIVGAVTKISLPIMDISSLSSPVINFRYKQEGFGSSQDELRVYYKTSETAAWQLLEAFVSNTPAFQTVEISLPNPSATYYIAFEGKGNNGYGIYVDDVSVKEGAVCPTPKALQTANITAREVQLRWVAGGGEDEWVVCYGPAGFEPGDASATVLSLTDNPYILSGLTPETVYEWYVRAKCSATEVSEWSAKGGFTTLAACIAPNNIQVTNPTVNSVTLNWDEQNSATSWTLEYKEGGYFVPGDGTATALIVDTNPYTLTSLTSGTTYTWYVKANCGGVDGESSWSSSASFATACDVVSSFPYIEDFETTAIAELPFCWTNSIEGGSTEWQVTQESYSNPNHTIYFDYVPGNVCKIVLPMMDLSSLLSPSISFKYKQEAYYDAQDELRVYYKASESESWQLLQEYTNDVPIFETAEIALPNPSSTYYIAFEGTGGDGNGINVDEIEVQGAPPVHVTGVDLDITNVTLVDGEHLQLIATVNPTDASNQNVSWESDNISVVTVDATGLITAVDSGTANVTVTTADGSFTANCSVTVTVAPPPVPTVPLSNWSILLGVALIVGGCLLRFVIKR